MSEVDQAQNAVDHGVADGYQCILPSHRNTGEYIGQYGSEKIQKTLLDALYGYEFPITGCGIGLLYIGYIAYGVAVFIKGDCAGHAGVG